jgi:hypothetical protein
LRASGLNEEARNSVPYRVVCNPFVNRSK